MIEFLKISSMAIFDEIEVEFSRGLNCITGETGAGKSLILDALTLLMGARSGREVVRPGSDKTTIEAMLSFDDREMALRREIYPTGSSRCYIDGRLATATSLAEVSSGLIHIYGQHDYQDLLSPRQHMKILEDLAGLSRDGVEAAYEAYIDAVRSLRELEDKIRALSGDREYLEHCLQELGAITLEEGLEERLQHELVTARKASELRESALSVQDIVYSGTPSIIDLSAHARQQIIKIARNDPGVERLVQGMDGILAILEDIHGELRSRIEAYEYDPEHVERLEERLHALRELKRKHRTDEPGLVALAGEIERKLALLDESGQNTLDARKAVEGCLDLYKRALATFLEKRAQAASRLSRQINKDLDELGMPGTDFKVEQQKPADLVRCLYDAQGTAQSPSVILKGEFLISTNVGQNVLPLAKIASGGELSRIMLAIKAQHDAHMDATMVFDEVDSGISGQTAIAIARKLRDISGRGQAIVVTHLHQVASVADAHFVITKKVKGKTTTSTLRRITGPDRVMELARMMGGDSPSLTAIEHARELVRSQEGRVTVEH